MKKNWKKPMVIALSNNHVKSANLQTAAVYESGTFVIQNTCVSAGGGGCPTSDNLLVSFYNSSGISPSATQVCLNSLSSTFGLSTAPPNCVFATFAISPIGSLMYGNFSTCTPSIQCS